MKTRLKIVLGLFLCQLVAKGQDNYKEISLPALMEKKKQGHEMVILDVRTKGEYADTSSMNRHLSIGRIKGAINIPMQELQQNADAIQQLNAYRDKEIYVICSHSYRSRVISNLLLKNGFARINNVQGGMTEWYRRYNELSPYRDQLETSISYKNISSAQVGQGLLDGKKFSFLGIASTPRHFFDSLTINFHNHFPALKNVVYYSVDDSLTILQRVRTQKNTSIVLFNTVNNGAAELAGWLTSKGIPHVSYMVGNIYYLYEYIRNNGLEAKTSKFFSHKNAIDFITSINLCKRLGGGNVQLVDLRHDSLFNKVSKGLKYEFAHARNAVNFFEKQGVQDFVKAFPDKKKEYILYSLNGVSGLELAEDLSRNGYKISWLMGGLQRLEWYTINSDDFACENILLTGTIN